jgi:hypothetical protein
MVVPGKSHYRGVTRWKQRSLLIPHPNRQCQRLREKSEERQLELDDVRELALRVPR